MKCEQTIFIPEEPDVKYFICELRKWAMLTGSESVSCKVVILKECPGVLRNQLNAMGPIQHCSWRGWCSPWAGSREIGNRRVFSCIVASTAKISFQFGCSYFSKNLNKLERAQKSWGKWKTRVIPTWRYTRCFICRVYQTEESVVNL